MERTLNFYLGMEPNSELQLNAQIRLHINQTELDRELNRVVNASKLTWMYWNQTRTEWELVESHMDQNGYLLCNTDHFSTWTVSNSLMQQYLQQIQFRVEYLSSTLHGSNNRHNRSRLRSTCLQETAIAPTPAALPSSFFICQQTLE